MDTEGRQACDNDNFMSICYHETPAKTGTSSIISTPMNDKVPKHFQY